MRSRFLKSKASEDELVNLTPLIDVLFVLLAVFIIALPLIQIDAIQLAKSTAIKKTASAISDSTLVIKVHKDNTVSINGKLTELKSMPYSLLTSFSQSPAPPLLIHDAQASFGTYYAVKSAIENAGYESVDVAIAP